MILLIFILSAIIMVLIFLLNMKKFNTEEYAAPEMTVLEILNEGFICSSNEKVEEIEGEW